ncbi:hypothetical protein [Novosphingobium sp. HR1a]|uniref:ribbon-helix-helix domain-containing protein n=2 Tax=Sphingomonadales TaxID=204457 RepID=UPI0003166160|nr:hypothetical protein [Novosphingobium sp. HR1a]MBF7012606.1 hypothetical protein [Novosphingobium sp. HR1a]
MKIMSQVKLDIPAEQLQWIEKKVSQGRFLDAAEYVRHLVRRDLERTEQEATASGHPLK